MPNQNNQVDWKEKFENHFVDVQRDHSLWKKEGKNPDKVIQFIEQTIHQETAKEVEEYKQFILNNLDGIDIADEQMGNKGGGTKALRFAIASKVIDFQPTNNTKE